VWVAREESVTVTEEDSCIGKAGKKHYQGSYQLQFGEGVVDIDALSFDEGMVHDKITYPLTLSSNPRDHFFAYAQYGSCNIEEFSVVLFTEGTCEKQSGSSLSLKEARYKAGRTASLRGYQKIKETRRKTRKEISRNHPKVRVR